MALSWTLREGGKNDKERHYRRSVHSELFIERKGDTRKQQNIFSPLVGFIVTTLQCSGGKQEGFGGTMQVLWGWMLGSDSTTKMRSLPLFEAGFRFLRGEKALQNLPENG